MSYRIRNVMSNMHEIIDDIHNGRREYTYPDSILIHDVDYQSDPTPRGSRSGWLPPKPYQRFIRKGRNPHGYYRFTDPENGVNERVKTGPLIQWPDLSTFFYEQADVSLYDAALTKAMLSIKEGEWNAAQTLAEARETAGMLGSLAKSTANTLQAIRGLRRGDISKFRDFIHGRGWKDRTKEMADKWLGYRYGVQPLVNDVQGAAEELAKSHLDSPPLITGKGFSKRNYDYNQVLDDVQFGHKIDVKCSEQWFVRLDFLPGNYPLALAKSLGFTNAPALAYELIPLSFVVDWFLPVGDFLSCFDYSLGLDFLGGSYSCRREAENKIQFFSTDSRADARVDGGVRTFDLDRGVYSQPPSVPLPSLKNGLNFLRMNDALSLLTQRLR